LNPFEVSTKSESADVKYLIDASQTALACDTWFP